MCEAKYWLDNNLDGTQPQRNRGAELNRLCWRIRNWCDGAALHTLILNVRKNNKKTQGEMVAIPPHTEVTGFPCDKHYEN